MKPRPGLPSPSTGTWQACCCPLRNGCSANVKAVQRMLGHASAAMTLGVYSGLFEDDLGALAERIDAAHEAHESSRTVGTVWARDPNLKIKDQAARC